MSNSEYYAAFADATTGAIADPTLLKNRIQDGGIDKELRATLWLRLFGVLAWADPAPRATLEEKRREYDALKAQWEGFEGNLGSCTVEAVKAHHQVIKNDVDRTDRKGPIFQEDGGALDALRRVLLSFCCSDLGSELGYFQGMNDMAAVILSVYDWREVTRLWMRATQP